MRTLSKQAFFCFCFSCFLVLVIWRPVFEWFGVSAFSDNQNKTLIQLRFKADQIKENNNLFQTANANQGIRVELTKTKIPQEVLMSMLATSSKDKLAIGNILTLNIGAKTGFLSLQVDNAVTVKQWHDLKVVAWNHHLVKVWLDGEQVINVHNPAIQYKIENFTTNRTFQGTITDFNLENHIVDLTDYKLIKKINNILIALFAILSLISFIWISTRSMSREYKLHYIALGILAGFFIAVFFHYIENFYFGNGSPHSTFLYYYVDQAFKDFYDTIRSNALFDPYYSHYLHGEYFPFSYVLVYPLTLLGFHLALFVYYLVFFAGYLFFTTRYFASNWLIIFILSFLTFPILFSFERGNLELILFLFLAAFLFFYEKNKIVISTVFLTAAISLKLYPIVFLALFLADKQYKALFFTLFLCLLTAILSLAILKNGIMHNLIGWHHVITNLNNACALTMNNCIQFSVSLWGAIKIIMGEFYKNKVVTLLGYKIYFVSGVIYSLLITAYIVFVEQQLWKKIALLVTIMLLFPSISFDYKMLSLYLPLFFFIKDQAKKYDLLYASLFVVILIPKNYYIFPNLNVGMISIIDPLLLITMSLAIIFQGLTQQRRQHYVS